MSLPLPLIPDYSVTELIGRGGMGRVYKAVDQRLGRTVAIKMLVNAEDPELVSRFEEEAKAVANLSHSNIARLFEFSRTESGQPYCVMEFISGGTLADAVNGRPLNCRLAASIVSTLAQAVQCAHAAGILHRDLKPGNILIAQPEQAETKSNRLAGDTAHPGETDGLHGKTSSLEAGASGRTARIIDPNALRIADFGLARRIDSNSRVTRTGQVIGTPAYMAPEQASGMAVRPGPGIDIYSLGVILFELLTGRPPFLGSETLETMRLLLSEEPPAPRSLQPTIPADLQTICLKCLQKKAARRYASAQDLADDLNRFLDGRPILARPTTFVERFWKWATRNPWKAIAAGLAAGSGVAAGIGFLLLQSAYRQTTEANLRLTEAIQQSNEAFQLSRETLDQIVNRVRDDLHEVPQATQLMLETSRDSVSLLRRLYQLRPNDLSVAHDYVNGLEFLANAEWIYGTRDQSVKATAELEGLLDRLLQQHSDDLTLKIVSLKFLVDKVQFPSETDSAEQQQQYRATLQNQFSQVMQSHSDVPDVLRLAIQVTQCQMTDALNQGNREEYLKKAKERVEWAGRYYAAETGEEKAEAGMWLVQAQRVLGESLLALKRPTEAAEAFRDALTSLEQLPSLIEKREFRSQMASVWLGLARVQSLDNDPAPAKLSCDQSLRILEDLVNDFPDDSLYRNSLASALLQSAELAWQQKDKVLMEVQMTAASAQIRQLQDLNLADSSVSQLTDRLTRLQSEIQSDPVQ